MIDFSDEEQLMLEAVSEFSTTEIKPIAQDIDRLNNFPHDLWQKMGGVGLLGINAPVAYGGSEMGYFAHCLVMQELSAASAAVGLSYAAHSNLCLNQISRYGTEEQKKAFLPDLITGKKIGSLAISEPNHGSDAVGMQLTAVEKSDCYALNGTKMWITNGPDADVMVVYAKTNKDLKAQGITAFIVTSEMSGIKKMSKIDKLGMRGSNTCEILFDNVLVPKKNILGFVNKGIEVLMTGLDYERVILAAGPVGIMQSALDKVIAYSKTRTQFGSPIGDFQLIQAKIADIYTSYVSSMAYLHMVAKNLDRNVVSRKDAASVILMAAENATKVALEAIQIFGANGYSNEYDVAILLRDAKLYEIGAGTSEIRRIIIGKDLLAGK
ncbi:MAG: acyl-CoA dehydrogenase family protein [Pseudomonadota bacterium]|nr:acyl-CoA dehydrogenase family protein [Pseudomonadota bacterium]